MNIKGNPKPCPQNLSSIGTQTSNTDEKSIRGVKKFLEIHLNLTLWILSESNIGEKEEDDDDPFFTLLWRDE